VTSSLIPSWEGQGWVSYATDSPTPPYGHPSEKGIFGFLASFWVVEGRRRTYLLLFGGSRRSPRLACGVLCPIILPTAKHTPAQKKATPSSPRKIVLQPLKNYCHHRSCRKNLIPQMKFFSKCPSYSKRSFRTISHEWL
jgi:hypothetical protein